VDIFDSLKISSSALRAQQIRLNTISSNLANIETTRTPEGGAYRKREVVFRSTDSPFAQKLEQSLKGSVQSVEVATIQVSNAPFKVVYDPSHPDADANGNVELPNVNMLDEMVDMTSATRAYEANVTAIKAAKRMALKALEIGR